MRSMKKLSVFFSIILLAICVRGMADTGQASGGLLLDADYAAFRAPADTINSADSAKTYVEIYYTIHRSQLSYQPSDSGYVAVIDFKLTLGDQNGKLIDSLTWRAANRINKLSERDDTNYLISDMVADIIPVGKYFVNLYISNGNNGGRASFAMDVPDFNKKNLGISTLELAYDIKPDSVGKFIKEGHKVLPNPSRQFLKENTVIYLYAEGYGLDVSPQSDTAYAVVLNILDSKGGVFKTIPASVHHKPGESAVIMTGFSIVSFKPGQYTLRVDLVDGADTVSSSRDFAVLETPQASRQAFMNTVLSDFPEANHITNDKEAASFRNDIIYIASSDELKLYDSLNLIGKATFQKKFWDDRNPASASPVNQYKIEHYRRLKYANSAYGQFLGEHAGWKTDRGRVYVLYGEPDEIERYPSSLETRSWERWFYNGIEGGIYFIFVDFETSEDYKLVHSSKKGEISDPNWEDKINMSPQER